MDLEWKGHRVACLEPLQEHDWVLSRYVACSDTWSTVTPVVLPGHDDRDGRKAEKLLRRAFLQAGLAPEVVDGVRDLEWRPTGFRPGVEHVARYLVPDRLVGPRFHVRVRFGSRVAGPLAIGSGRHRGMGVFAIE
jgi:CRISPR-associated protein Csb2